MIERAREPGVSIAAVALANGLNANMLRRWVREADGADVADGAAPGRGACTVAMSHAAAPAFVQLALPAPSSSPVLPTAASTFVEIHRDGTSVYVTLPAGANSAAWLREVLA